MPEINKVKIKNPITGSMDEYSIGSGASDMKGASADQDGAHGLVPAPLRGDQDKFLKADGTWAESSSSLTATEITKLKNLLNN